MVLDYDFYSLWRGAQSALFFYFSCAPCAAYAYRRKRAKQIARERAEREEYRRAEPMAYRQPSPYRTNEHWAEEIRLGPGPPSRRMTKKQRAARAKELARRKTGISSIGVSKTERATPVPGRERNGTLGREESSEEGLEDGGRTRDIARPTQAIVVETEKWRLVQRLDEHLWGEAVYPGSLPSERSSAATKDSQLSIEKFPTFIDGLSSGNAVKNAANPAVNDLHPPAVSNPAFSAGSNMWMLQPPPPVTVMKGYDSPSNSRSSTGGSSETQSSRRGGSTGSGSVLGRNLSLRLAEEKLRRAQMLYPNELRRGPPNWSTNADLQEMEIKYYGEDPQAANKRQGVTSNPSDKAGLSAKGDPETGAKDSSVKADSGVEMRSQPGLKENTRHYSTHTHDFAFALQEGKEGSAATVSSANLPPVFLDEVVEPEAVPASTQPPLNTSSYRQNTSVATIVPSNGRIAIYPKRMPLARKVKAGRSLKNTAGVHGDEDADDEGDDNDDNDNNTLDGDATLRRIEASKAAIESSGKPQPQQLLKSSAHNERWDRRQSVGF